MYSSIYCHPNPGPAKPVYKFPCGICEKPVKSNQRGVQCDDCDVWFHTKCMSMPSAVYKGIEGKDVSWICCSCGLPNFSSTLFFTPSSDSINTSIATENSYSVLSSLSGHHTGSPAPSSSSTSFSSMNSSIGSPMHMSSPLRNTRQEKRLLSSFRVMIVNFQSLRAKKSDFWLLLQEIEPDIIIGNETWLHQGFYECEVIPPNYHIVARRDRSSSPHGGVIIIAKDNITGTDLHVNTNSEFCAASFECPGKSPLIIGSAYRPPNTDGVYMEELCAQMKNLHMKYPSSTIWIAGDMNLPDIDWNTSTITSNSNPVHINQLLLDTVYDTGSEQMVTFPTRGKNTLDLFITNRPSLVEKIKPAPGVSDHDIVFIQTNSVVPRKRPPRRKLLLWNKADTTKLSDSIRNFSTEFTRDNTESTDVNFLWNRFKDFCTEAIEASVPSKLSSTRFSQPWVNRKVKRLSRQKKRAYRKAKMTNSSADFDTYKRLQKDTRAECRRAHNTYVSDLVSENNSKKLYTFIKGRRCDSSGVSSLRSNGVSFSDPKTKATLLNNQFCSVFTEEASSNMPTMDSEPSPSMHQFSINEEGVVKLLRDLNPHKATGPDSIPTRFLKDYSEMIAPSLTLIFQASLQQGCAPSDWKSANVTPLFKKGDRSSPSNYRPISLTSVCSKIMEHIIHSQVMKHLDLHNILSDAQHGFRKKRSCESQLILTIQDLAAALDDGEQIDAILLDFSKAFDKVPHRRLLYKLDHYGIRGNTLQWISSFLTDRSQRVVVENQSSTSAPVTSGVPQGSVIGPLLFLLYINDMPAKASSTTRLFADDSLLYRKIKTIQDSIALQEDLDRLQKWEEDWQMSFNPSKCEVIRFSRKRNPTSASYSIHGQILTVAKTGRYLGVTLSEDLSWKPHVEATVKKANNSLAFLRRNLQSCPSTIKDQCYKSLVRPILEYAAPTWDPHTQNCIQSLEAVQRRAARFVTGDYHTTSSTSQMMNQLGWKTLQQRRHCAKVIMVYRIIYFLVDIDPSCYYRTSNAINTSARFMVPFCRTDSYRHSFFPSSVRLWNALPAHLTGATTIEAFKEGIINHM